MMCRRNSYQTITKHINVRKEISSAEENYKVIIVTCKEGIK